jgi:thiol-disulfide isomerase/thioredoxin
MKSILLIIMIQILVFGYSNGEPINQDVKTKLSIEENKTYVVAFFASWCGSCKNEIPYISKLNTTIDKKQIEIIGVDADENIDAGITFQNRLKSENKLNFRVVNDPKGEIIKAFSPIGMPALYIIKGGKVVNTILGAKDNIDVLITKELEKIK